jgi:acetyl-CoA synthetase
MSLPQIRDYPHLWAAFRWAIPEYYNIGVDICDRWAQLSPERPAILEIARDGAATATTYGQLQHQSNRLANVLSACGVQRGDRVAILLPQMAEVAICHIAIYKLGAIALPLASLFGADALEFRLKDAGVTGLLTDAAGVAKLKPIRHHLESVGFIISTDGSDAAVLGFAETLARASSEFTPVITAADDAAMMIYTSGTTGPPKGALHAHRVLIGHLPGVQFSHEYFPQAGDRLWTPADWAWAGGLLNALLPALHFGVPIVARKFEKFDPEAALELMKRAHIRNAFIPPTALRMLRSVDAIGSRFSLDLRSLCSAGEALGSEIYAWGQQALGLTINEFYGQTECNYVLSSCHLLGVSKAGAIGKPVPGHRVAVITADGRRCAPRETGQIAILQPDPAMFLRYWGQPQSTADKFIGNWMTTGDLGATDEEGYFHFFGRDDDVITSSGYRIGPGEVEDCLLRHPAVSIAAVVGKPDPLRTEIVKAFIVLKRDFQASSELAADLQAFVRARLSAHEYPREIAFVTELPLTTTGKVMRRILRQQG